LQTKADSLFLVKLEIILAGNFRPDFRIGTELHINNFSGLFLPIDRGYFLVSGSSKIGTAGRKEQAIFGFSCA
jgi:hypothetical protein